MQSTSSPLPRRSQTRIKLDEAEREERARLRREEAQSRGGSPGPYSAPLCLVCLQDHVILIHFACTATNPRHEVKVIEQFRPILDRLDNARKPRNPKPLLLLREMLIFNTKENPLVYCSPLDLHKKSPAGLGGWKNGIELWALAEVRPHSSFFSLWPH